MVGGLAIRHAWEIVSDWAIMMGRERRGCFLAFEKKGLSARYGNSAFDLDSHECLTNSRDDPDSCNENISMSNR